MVEGERRRRSRRRRRRKQEEEEAAAAAADGAWEWDQSAYKVACGVYYLLTNTHVVDLPGRLTGTTSV
eukprot:COSAG01_NODE_56659_length_317_cov_0.467890_1_plen_68_part_00